MFVRIAQTCKFSGNESSHEFWCKIWARLGQGHPSVSVVVVIRKFDVQHELFDGPFPQLGADWGSFVHGLDCVRGNEDMMVHFDELDHCKVLEDWTSELFRKRPGIHIGLGVAPRWTKDLAIIQPFDKDLEGSVIIIFKNDRLGFGPLRPV